MALSQRHPWPQVRLGDILTERAEIPDPDDIETGRIPIIAKISFSHGAIELRDDGKTRTKMILIRPGDLVVSGINAAKGAIAIYDEGEDSPIAATIHYAAYIPDKSHIDVRYLWRLLRSQAFRDVLKRNVPGGVKTELRAKRLLPIQIPLPPLDEQRHIVARIEELTALIEEAQGLRRKARGETGALLPSAVAHLCSQFECDTRPLAQVLAVKPSNGWSAKCDNDPSGTPVLTLSAVTGFRYDGTQIKTTSLPIEENARYWLQKGDLLISRSNTPELVGHAAIYDGVPEKCIYPDPIMRTRVKEDEAEVRFVHYWLMTLLVRDFIQSRARGTSPSMKKIAQRDVMEIPFPEAIDLAEQLRIVAYLDDLQAQVDELTALQDSTQAELDALLPSVLDKAFKGEL